MKATFMDWEILSPSPTGRGLGSGLSAESTLMNILSLNATRLPRSTIKRIDFARQPSSPALLPKEEGRKTFNLESCPGGLVIATEQGEATHPEKSHTKIYPEWVTKPAIVRTIRKKTRWPWLVITVLVVSVLLYALGPLVWQLSFGRPGHVDFYLHKSKYRNIVTRVKELPLAAGAQNSTLVDGVLVNATRNASGAYTVTITTVDWRHAGVYGYVFSDVPLTPHPNQNYPDSLSVDNPGDMPFSDKRIIGQGGHWWSVYNNLL
jgi:hypothetical protein